jgi:hypothetical protein
MNIINFNNSNKCPICFENIIGGSDLNCGHKICSKCLIVYTITSFDKNKKIQKNFNCPLCNSSILTIKDDLISDDDENKKRIFYEITIICIIFMSIYLTLCISITFLQNYYYTKKIY